MSEVNPAIQAAAHVTPPATNEFMPAAAADTHGTADTHGAPATGTHGEAPPAQPKQSRMDKLFRRAPEAPKPPSNEGANARQSSVVEGGKTTKTIQFDPETKAKITDILTARITKAELSKTREPISEIDQRLIESGIMGRLADGTYTDKDIFTIQAVITDDYLEGSAYIGRIGVYDKRQGRDVGIRQDGKIMTRMDPDRRYNQPTEEKLAALNALRIKVNETLLGKGAKDPLIDYNSSIYPYDLMRGSGLIFNQELAKQIDALVTQYFPGESVKSIWKKDRPKMAEIMIQANENAFKFLIEGRADSILRDPPDISVDAIRQRATEAGGPPSQEKIAQLTKEVAEATEAELNAQQAYDALEAKYKSLKVLKRTKDDADAAVRSFNTSATGPGGLIETARQNLFDTKARQAEADPKQKSALQTSVDRYAEELKALLTKQEQLLNAQATAGLNFTNEEQAELDEIYKAADGTNPATGKLKDAEEALGDDTRGRKKDTIDKQKALKAAQESGPKPSKEAVAKSEQLTSWADSYEKKGKITETIWKQGDSDPYSIKSIKDITITPDGTVKGYDALLELMFIAADPKGAGKHSLDHYRQMMRPEVFAQRVLKEFPVRDPNEPISPLTHSSLNALIHEIEQGAPEINALMAQPSRTNEVEYRLRTIMESRRRAVAEITQIALNQLPSANKAGFASFVNELMIEGARSAMRGDPQLKLNY